MAFYHYPRGLVDDLDGGVGFVLIRLVLALGFGATLPGYTGSAIGTVVESHTIFCPPGPVPFRYEMEMSASLILMRGGRGLEGAIGVWLKNRTGLGS